MKVKLLIPVLFACLFSLSLQAENPSALQKTSSNELFATYSAIADTISIPWREDFEIIQKENEYPRGMTVTYLESTTQLPIQTYIAPNLIISPSLTRIIHSLSIFEFETDG